MQRRIKAEPVYNRDRLLKPYQFVFVSYKSEESERAKSIVDALEREGIAVWYDEALQCGHDWQAEIDNAIRSAGVIVVLWTKKAVQSTWVKYEATVAMNNDNYAPARMELVDIDSPFNRIQATDLFHWSGDEKDFLFQNLVSRIREVMPRSVPLHYKAGRWIWRNIAVIIILLIAFGALGIAIYLLRNQGAILVSQAEQQEKLRQQAESTAHQLGETKAGIDTQLENLKSLSNETGSKLSSTSELLSQQLSRAEKIQNELQSKTAIIQKSTNRTLDSLSSTQKNLLVVNAGLTNLKAGLDTSIRDLNQMVVNTNYPLTPLKVHLNFLVDISTLKGNGFIKAFQGALKTSKSDFLTKIEFEKILYTEQSGFLKTLFLSSQDVDLTFFKKRFDGPEILGLLYRTESVEGSSKFKIITKHSMNYLLEDMEITFSNVDLFEEKINSTKDLKGYSIYIRRMFFATFDSSCKKPILQSTTITFDKQAPVDATMVPWAESETVGVENVWTILKYNYNWSSWQGGLHF